MKLAPLSAFAAHLEYDIASTLDWLGIHPSGQDFAKCLVLTVFVLIILMVLGDVYRGEIQNTYHRIRLIGHPREEVGYKHALQLPKYMLGTALDGVFSNALFHIRYRDARGRIRTRYLYSYRVKFKVRQAFADKTAPGQEKRHSYTEDEKTSLAREMPDIEEGKRPMSEIVSIARSRADLIAELAERRMTKQHDRWSKLERSRWRRWLAGIKQEELMEPEELGLVVKFHFPINPYFLLYRHPDTNVRSTAWLTVLTSVFALFMQIVFSPGTQADPTSVAGRVTTAFLESSHTQ